MLNPFREHFWRHVWSAWSEPFQKPWILADGKEGVKWFQQRKCRECGAVDVKELLTAKEVPHD